MTVREVLEEIRERHGQLTPRIVMEEARPDESPIHSYVFNRPADEAAEEYYIMRAHRLIQTVRVRVAKPDGTGARMVRAYYAVPSQESAYVYEPLSVVLASDEKRSSVLREAIRRVTSAKKAVDELQSLIDGRSHLVIFKRVTESLGSAIEDLESLDEVDDEGEEPES